MGRTKGCDSAIKFRQQQTNPKRREHGQKRKASRDTDKNAGSVFEQRNALARQRAHLRDEVRNRAGRACHGWRVLRLSDLTVFPERARFQSQPHQVPA
ncbi:hypothetical protein C9381_16795 [Pantoea vagans]|uniref:Uncharacterized protein n=1 Tax=Pantoea vagans TaxID=470934 RepID=A0AAN1TWS0_9GAMM|nr:hypothetical protein C9381_16795 [Pantoea vagans]